MHNAQKIDDLDTLSEGLKPHAPQLVSVLTPLTAELRIISRKGFQVHRSGLEGSLDNLVEGLSELLSIKQANICDENVKASEIALERLALDMRKRSTETIRDRTSMLRINTEVSAHRADPDIQPMDITDGYRLLAATPVEDGHADMAEVIGSFPLPSEGGQSGQIKGKHLFLSIVDPSRREENVAPQNTYFLPAGRCVRLNAGEQVILRTQGMRHDNVPLSFGEFKDHQQDFLIEAAEDGLMIFGPATLSPQKMFSLHEYETGITQLVSVTQSLSRKEAFLCGRNNEIVSDILWGIAVFSLLPGMLSVLFSVASISSNGVSLHSFLPMGIMAMITATSAGSGYVYKWMNEKRIRNLMQRLNQKVDLDMINKKAAIAGIPMASLNVDDAKTHAERLRSEDSMRFYPVRHVIIADTENVKTIEPLAALPAPDHRVVPFARPRIQK